MTCSTSRLDRSLMPQSHETDIRVLGETGQTVVYIFPDGRGMAERDTPDFDAIADHPPAAANAETQLLEDLITAGKMSQAQKIVVLHDQQNTGMTIAEILTARGWL